MIDGQSGNGMKIQTMPLSVTVVDGEIIVEGIAGSAPSLSSDAARKTGALLILAADKLDTLLQ